MSKDGFDSLDEPRSKKRRLPSIGMSPEAFGRAAEAFARFMGTPQFLVGMTVFCAVWLLWNTLLPENLQFDPKALNFTLLTLILSLQASYAAPLILLAENRSTDRDRVEFENDRQRAERNLADTEFLTREVASLRIAMREMATRDFIRSELRNLLDEIDEARAAEHRQELKTVKKTAVRKAVKKAQQTAEQTAREAMDNGQQGNPAARGDDEMQKE